MAGVDSAGLEGSCSTNGDWARSALAGPGLELFEARFAGHAYDRHRHDVYAIGLTLQGVQCFTCRGADRASVAGRSILLHPDELHDGRAGTPEGFSYRMAYVEPALIQRALDERLGHRGALPFAPEIVVDDPVLAQAIERVFVDFPAPLEPLARDQAVLSLAEALLRHDPALKPARAEGVDARAVARARDFLDAAFERVVDSGELEAVAGLDRFRLARQFRRRYGTSPYRYLTMRRLQAARRMILDGTTLAEVAAATGFADQSHLTRQFKAGYGLTPGRLRRLSAG